MIEKKRKRVYLECIRILAAFLVILNHVDINYFYYHNTDNLITFIISLFVTIIVRVNVPLFLMISGIVLIENYKGISDIFKKKIPRIVIITILFSIIHYVINIFRNRIEHPSLFDFIKKVIGGEIQETYWFLYMYIAILILLPFIRYIAINVTKSELFLLTIIKVILDFLPFISLEFGIGISTNLISELSSFSGYVYYVILGYNLNKYYEEPGKALDVRVAFLLLVGILLPGIFTTYSFFFLEEIKDSIVGTTTALISISVFLMIKKYFDKKVIEKKVERIILLVGSCTFSIYLLEQLSRMLLKKTYLFLIANTVGVFASVVYVIEAFLLSLFIALILKRIPIIRNYL